MPTVYSRPSAVIVSVPCSLLRATAHLSTRRVKLKAMLSTMGTSKNCSTTSRAPLGLNREDNFRISVAGAQEKTALLWHDDRSIRPSGTTPTTHIFKTQIGKLPDGLDLSYSVENDYYCLRLLAVFGLPVNEASTETFGRTKVLVIKRFDRRWTKDGRLLWLPQEDFC